MCYKSDCQSENQKIKAYFDKLLPNTSTNIIDTPSTSKDEKKIDLDQKGINNTENPCQAGSQEAIKACQEELNKLENCLTQFTEKNKDNTYDVIRCYKSNCKSENNDVQDYFEKKIASMNTGISILAFTVIASVLSLLLQKQKNYRKQISNYKKELMNKNKQLKIYSPNQNNLRISQQINLRL